jgi:hypothetical protein
MLIDQLIPHLPKDNEEVNAHLKRLQAMLDAATVVDLVLDCDGEVRGHELDHRQSPHEDSTNSLTASEERDRRWDRDDCDLHDVICGRDARDQINNRRQERERVEHERCDERDYDYYGPFYNQPHRQRSPEGGHNLGGVKAFSHNLKRVRWPINFNPSGLEKYDGSTNPTKWLEVYQLAIEAASRDSYVMANYLLVCLSSSAITWLVGLPSGSVYSWTHLCRLFNSNFCAICTRLGIKWDLASVIQKKGESL